MADLSAIFRNAVKVIDKETKTAQTPVTIHRWTGQTYDGSPTYAAPMVVMAVVEYKSEARQSSTGQDRVGRAKIIIPAPIAALGAAGRSEPIDERDLVTLPNMTTAPIVEVYGVVDPLTKLPYSHEILLGDRRGE